MNKSKLAFKEGFDTGWSLFWSPFLGLFNALKKAFSNTKNRPVETIKHSH
jgi:hypothetical protein